MMYYVIAWIGIIGLAIVGWLYVKKVKLDAEFRGWNEGYDRGWNDGYKKATKDVKVEVVDLM